MHPAPPSAPVYPDRMATPNLQPATPDELALIYLRARDVPCPNCHYNRRDDRNAACPECGHNLLIREGTPLESRAHTASLRRIANIILIAVALAIAGDLFNLVRSLLIVSRTGMPLQPMIYSFVWLGLNLLFAAIAMFLARKAAVALRPNPADTGAALRLLTLAVIAVLMTGILSLPLAMLFAIIR